MYKLSSSKYQRAHWWLDNIGSGHGLVLSGNKPEPEKMLNQNY